MSWWCMWPLLLMAVNAGAELYLLKHGEYLYCASDDEDTPALAWNHKLDKGNEPLESVYWSKPSHYSEINCKPEFGNKYCNGWDIGGWSIVPSYEKDLPPVLDHRWNDLQRFVEPRGKITHNKLLLNSSAQHLYIPVSLLVRNSAVVILRSGNEDWRFAIDAQIKSEPKVGVELWKWNTITESSDIVGATHKGRVLHNGMRWTTVLLKYEARSQGDILKFFNPEARMELTWETKQTINSVKELRFYSHRDSPGLFGHWRFHLC